MLGRDGAAWRGRGSGGGAAWHGADPAAPPDGSLPDGGTDDATRQRAATLEGGPTVGPTVIASPGFRLSTSMIVPLLRVTCRCLTMIRQNPVCLNRLGFLPETSRKVQRNESSRVAKSNP
jgi:hypothetical protein